jgi:hypothetical protein
MLDERPSDYTGFSRGPRLSIPFLGLVLVDHAAPDALAQARREEDRYEFLFTATPLRLRRATEAPAHPIGIF